MKFKIYAAILIFIQTSAHADIVFMNGIKNPCHITIEDLQDMLASAPQKPYPSVTVPKANCTTVEIYYRKDEDIR